MNYPVLPRDHIASWRSRTPTVSQDPAEQYLERDIQLGLHPIGKISWIAEGQRTALYSITNDDAFYRLILSSPDTTFTDNNQETARIFSEQRSRWLEDTSFTSSVSEIVSHPSYLRIIGLGKPALPFIFSSLKQEPAHWFVALMSITGEDPVDGRNDLSFEDIVGAWVEYGTKHGYC